MKSVSLTEFLRLSKRAGSIKDGMQGLESYMQGLEGDMQGLESDMQSLEGEMRKLRMTGEITLWSAAAAPGGWLICDGSAVSRSGYAALYAVIGTTYGTGNGTTTFNIPNLKGRVPAGYSSSDSSFNTLGKTGGSKTHALSVSEMPSHTHTYKFSNYSVGIYPGGDVLSRYENDVYNGTTRSAGSGSSHNNLQPYVVLNYIIKT
ncbi:MAG: phage tail protein [Christensenellales bacterium]|jgi:microcystin-dependent protein